MNWLGRITDKTVALSDFRYDAEGWGTCAVGEIRQNPGLVTTVYSHEPKDKRLKKLGLDFADAVGRNQRGKALKLYLAIHRRAAKLAGVGV